MGAVSDRAGTKYQKKLKTEKLKTEKLKTEKLKC
jgi:hypothetical protein